MGEESNINAIIYQPEYRWNNKRGDPIKLHYKFVVYNKEFKKSQPITYEQEEFKKSTVASHPVSDFYKKLIKEGMSKWENVANIKFIESNSKADIYIGCAFNVHSFVANALPIQPDFKKFAIIFNSLKFNEDRIDNVNDLYNNYLPVHELGHVLGLTHPHQGGITLPIEYDVISHTVMSYNLKYVTDLYSTTPMPLDIEAIQKFYGKNTSYNKGNTIYKYYPNQKDSLTIWDAGGEDTIDASAFSQGVRIDLREGFEHRSVLKQVKLFIAKGANIENAIGGNGDDIIWGNHLNNVINSGNGNDVMYGNGSKNKFIFKRGGFGKKEVKDFKSGLDKIILKGFNNAMLKSILKSKKTSYMQVDNKKLYDIDINLHYDHTLKLSGLNSDINAIDFIIERA